MQTEEHNWKAPTAFGIDSVHRKMIDGHDYETTLLPAGAAFDHVDYLLDLLAGPSGVVLDFVRGAIARSSVLEADTSGGEIREGLHDLAQVLARHGRHQKIKAMLQTTTVRAGERVYSCSQDFDEVFQGRITTMCKVLAWVLEVNYLPFLREVLPAWQAHLQILKSRYAAPSSEPPDA